ncbi:uncharacterized protein FTJAE_1910 [Fusarium tjaetaba]|uniref:Uncharacterized protein n=1 Tax=Fusarium tjaetaba TaxID=1567544 RepID=A0A8H5S8S2_9HYPO|nr:uncharacterized protein FTJAE_1910 [Fusarium tjaetaba]KAF5646620.1 hypothetical protein FTJAE_1910 [Fusarium tjaetaba]
MASRAIIPRFLLPLQGPLWRGISIPLSQNSIRIRFASSSSKGKPIVLEKPARFNPPSHGSRLKKNHVPKHYGPELTASEVAAQNKKHYPGMMAPEGTWEHFFWHSRLLHTFITMGTLFALGVFTFFMNYAYNSPYKELVPPISDLWTHPLHFFVAWKNVIVLHEKDKAEKARDHRTNHLDDVAKRRLFMKMHGIEAKDPVTVVFGKGEEDPKPEQAAVEDEPVQKTEVQEKVEEPKKKWFGVF